MIKWGILILAGLSNYGYSQTVYSSLIVKNNDTACVVSTNTIRTYNHAIADLKACNVLVDSMAAELNTADLISINDNKIIDQQDLQISNLQGQFKEQKSIIDLSDKQLKRKDRNIKFQKLGLYLAGAIIVVETGYIGIVNTFKK